MIKERLQPPPPGKTAEQVAAEQSRRGFLALGVSALAGYGAWSWLRHSAPADGIPVGFRDVLKANERIQRAALFSEGHLAPTFPLSAAREVRENGDVGLGDDFNPAQWRLSLQPYGKSDPSAHVSLADIQKLPKVEHVTSLKCIEGWSTVVHWAGARLSDVTARYAPGSEKAQYVGMQTPDEEYYVGLDMPSALHPQTLLCYEMNGQPLTAAHGAPLRLVIPVKYGIKNLKRIGTITYTNARPDDYWAEQGYDWYAGL